MKGNTALLATGDRVLVTLNNREWALVFWVLVLAIFVVAYRPTRSQLPSLLRQLFWSSIGIALLAMTVYVSLLILVARRIHAWDPVLLKDTLLWYFGVATVMFFSVHEVSKGSRSFRSLVLTNLRFAIVLEFIINLYVFNIFIELLLVPILALIAGIAAVAETRPEHKPVRTSMDVLLACFGIYLVIHAVVSIVSDFQGFASFQNMQAFLLPITLTILLVPFLYLLTVYMAYESVFNRVEWFLRRKEQLVGFAKRRVFRACLLRLSKVKRFSGPFAAELGGAESRVDVIRIVRLFEAGR
jgi:hypothetical protein